MTCSPSIQKNLPKPFLPPRNDERHFMADAEHAHFMKLALRLARRGLGYTSPNPAVGALLVQDGEIIGSGWHQRAGGPHAEIEAIRNAQSTNTSVRGSTLYVTLEPCSTHGRTPPCVEAILAAGIQHVVIGAIDPNPHHRGRGVRWLQEHGIKTTSGILEDAATSLNESFNHWIVHRTPLVSLKCAMTLDGKIATVTGQSKWITSLPSRRWAMRLRQHSDAILVGINTVLADDPALTWRPTRPHSLRPTKQLRRIVLDTHARTPLTAKVVSDLAAEHTTIFVSEKAPEKRRKALAARVRVQEAPLRNGQLDLRWITSALGAAEVTSLLVEGGGRVHASFLEQGLAHRLYFLYAPRIVGGAKAAKAIAGVGAATVEQMLPLQNVLWRKIGPDLLLAARLSPCHQPEAVAARD